MSRFNKRVEWFLDLFISKGIKKSYALPDLFKVRLLVAIAGFFTMVSFASVTSQLAVDSTMHLTLAVPFISIFTSLSVLMLVRVRQTHHAALNLFQACFVVLLSLSILHNKSILSPPMFCLPIIPMMFAVLAGIKRALYIFTICLAVAVYSVVAEPTNPYLDDLHYKAKTFAGLISVFAASMVILGLAYVSKKLNVLVEDDLKQQRHKAENTEQMKTMFLANISHEIRTPLNNVIGHTELLRDRLEVHDFANFHIQNIFRSSQQLVDTINNVIEASRLDIDAYDFQPKEVELPRVIYDSAIVNIQNAESRGINVSLNLSDHLRDHSIIVPPDALTKIIYHLVSNATKFTAKGQVSIKADYDHALRCLVLVITDTGVGMDDRTQAMIFDKFLQGNEDLTREYGGLGLGLTIAKTVVEKVAGEIAVQSKTGIGSTFTIKVPARLKTDQIRVGANAMTVHVIDASLLIYEFVQSASKNMPLAVCRYRTIDQLDSAEIANQDMVIIQNPRCQDTFLAAIDLVTKMAPGAMILVHGSDTQIKDDKMDRRYVYIDHIDQFTDYLPDFDNAITMENLATVVPGMLTPPPKENTQGASAKLPSAMPENQSGANPKKILIVDDAEDNRALMRLYLQSEGYQITMAADGLEAVDRAKEQAFDLILMDIQMPNMDGFEATAKIKEWEKNQQGRKSTPIVIVTAHDIEEHRDQCEQLDTAGFITKPLRKKEFTKKVASFLKEIHSTRGAA